MMDFYKYSRIFQVGPRGSGRTHAICEAAKLINAKVVVAGAVEAARLAANHKATVLVLDLMPVRFTGPILVDHAAMAEICRRYEYRVEHLLKKNTELREMLIEQGYPSEKLKTEKGKPND